MSLDDGRVLESADVVHDEAVGFFQHLFLTTNVNLGVPELELLVSSVTMKENLSLCKTPSIEEVKNALWSIPLDSSPGLDGFSA